jgi:hypothetical protein
MTMEHCMTRDELIDAYWAGDFGDVEFVELSLEAGVEVQEISQVMWDVRKEDGTL